MAPSEALRRWFGHDPAKWADFQRCYWRERDRNLEAWQPIVGAAHRGNVTLLDSARDTAHNNAVGLKVYVQKALEAAPEASHSDRWGMPMPYGRSLASGAEWELKRDGCQPSRGIRLPRSIGGMLYASRLSTWLGDEVGDGVAAIACGHGRRMRH